VVGAVAAIGLVSMVLISVLGDGSRDERSYQEGRKDGSSGSVLVKWGGETPEGYCKNQYNLITLSGNRSDLRHRDYLAGCLDGMKEALNHTP
jgi:hypothetical protein